MEYFWQLGGVPRYVLYTGHTRKRLAELLTAVGYLDSQSYLKLFTGRFEEKDVNDCLVHMKCSDDKYDEFGYDFASLYVRDEFGKSFTQLSKELMG
jgi:hypothetical protein